ncbi:hypothetical protein PAPYR_10741 [Paratrimastix pyriformis]|uniref:Uncharacterized protein n=1 Tax=Paratrimastix pyriformis TaxID=342808 RepID=A0ABQ8U929_9EUKA|nr:hypothetical protein PAPYR_10741 [Paratrimastix pyriformis]
MALPEVHQDDQPSRPQGGPSDPTTACDQRSMWEKWTKKISWLNQAVLPASTILLNNLDRDPKLVYFDEPF